MLRERKEIIYIPESVDPEQRFEEITDEQHAIYLAEKAEKESVEQKN